MIKIKKNDKNDVTTIAPLFGIQDSGVQMNESSSNYNDIMKQIGVIQEKKDEIKNLDSKSRMKLSASLGAAIGVLMSDLLFKKNEAVERSVLHITDLRRGMKVLDKSTHTIFEVDSMPRRSGRGTYSIDVIYENGKKENNVVFDSNDIFAEIK